LRRWHYQRIRGKKDFNVWLVSGKAGIPLMQMGVVDFHNSCGYYNVTDYSGRADTPLVGYGNQGDL
jgi:hypothetical protein